MNYELILRIREDDFLLYDLAQERLGDAQEEARAILQWVETERGVTLRGLLRVRDGLLVRAQWAWYERPVRMLAAFRAVAPETGWFPASKEEPAAGLAGAAYPRPEPLPLPEGASPFVQLRTHQGLALDGFRDTSEIRPGAGARAFYFWHGKVCQVSETGAVHLEGALLHVPGYITGIEPRARAEEPFAGAASQAMDHFTFAAERAAKAGDLPKARRLYTQAALIETAAAARMNPTNDRLYAVLAQSAVALWFHAGNRMAVERLVDAYLADPALHLDGQEALRALRAALP